MGQQNSEYVTNDKRKNSLDLSMLLVTGLVDLSILRRKVLSTNTKGNSSGMGSPLKYLYKEKTIFWLQVTSALLVLTNRECSEIKSQIHCTVILVLNYRMYSNIMTNEQI